MNKGSKTVALSFVAGALLASVVLWLLLRPSFPSVRALQCEVQPTEFLDISGFKIKILDHDVQSPKPRKGEAAQPRMATLQWRCDVKNISAIALRYHLQAELLDKDGFVLATGTIDSNYGEGDLPLGQTQTIRDDIVLDYSRAKSVASARITPTALKTNAQMQQEQETQRAARKASVDKARERWEKLRQGINEAQVEWLLGRPLSVASFGHLGYWWYYPPVEGSCIRPRVEFSESGVVIEWEPPQ